MTDQHEKEARAKARPRSKLQIAEDLEAEAKKYRAEALEREASKTSKWVRRAIYVRNWLTRNELHAASKQVQQQIKAAVKDGATPNGITQKEIDDYTEPVDETVDVEPSGTPSEAQG